MAKYAQMVACNQSRHAVRRVGQPLASTVSYTFTVGLQTGLGRHALAVLQPGACGMWLTGRQHSGCHLLASLRFRCVASLAVDFAATNISMQAPGSVHILMHVMIACTTHPCKSCKSSHA